MALNVPRALAAVISLHDAAPTGHLEIAQHMPTQHRVPALYGPLACGAGPIQAHGQQYHTRHHGKRADLGTLAVNAHPGMPNLLSKPTWQAMPPSITMATTPIQAHHAKEFHSMHRHGKCARLGKPMASDATAWLPRQTCQSHHAITSKPPRQTSQQAHYVCPTMPIQV